jgi:hypothetical protein
MRYVRILRCLATALVYLGAATLVHSFANSGSTKITANQIVEDVVVTDDAGQPVKGLRQRDFRVYENKKQQKIRSFEAHDEQAGPQPSQPPSLPANTFTNAASSDSGPINVVLLDQLSTSIADQELARSELIDFLKQSPSNTLFAIFALRNDEVACKPYNRPQWSFGASNVDVPAGDAGCSSRGALVLVDGITGDKGRLIAALNSNLATPHPAFLRTRLGFTPVSLLSSGQVGGPLPPVIPGLGNFGQVGGASPIFGGDYYNGGPTEVYDTSMSALAEIGNFLQSLPGRKTLVWMSDSFDAAPVAAENDIWFPPKFKGWEKTDPFSPTQMVHLAADRLDLARVAIYPVDLTGKNKGIDIKRAGLSFNNSSFPYISGTTALAGTPTVGTFDEHGLRLDTVADQSGGKAFHNGDRVQDAMTKAVSDGAAYYTLTYSPAKNKFDGKLRDIKIEVEGKDYHIAYRKKYFADDPSSLDRSATAASPDVYLPNPNGPIPWKALRVETADTQSSSASTDPLLTAMRYGAPESHDLVFTVRVEPTQAPMKATPAQMNELQDYESFLAERISKAMQNLTKQEKKKQPKGSVVLNYESLPPADPVFVQPFSVDYFIATKQLNFKPAANGDDAVNLEIAILAYDTLGKKVAVAKETISDTISASELQQFQASDYHIQQNLEIPERATMLLLAVRDVSSNRIGSVEVPLWAISSPYRRKRLPFPTAASRLSQKKKDTSSGTTTSP